MDRTQEHSIIPEGLVRCVWMDAGMVSYKLCDRFLQCDGCPFDAVFRQHGKAARTVHTEEFWRNSYETSAQSNEESIRSQLDVLLAPFMDIHLANDRMYCANHTWLKKDDDGAITVGLDHLGAHILSSIACLVLPQPPMRTHMLSPCVWIMRPEGAIALRTPVTGVITSTNERLKEDPSLVTRDPYHEGWIFAMRAEEEQQSELLNASHAQKVFCRQGDVLRQEFTKRISSQSHVGVTLHDGGRHVESLQDLMGGKAYFSVIAPIFVLKQKP